MTHNELTATRVWLQKNARELALLRASQNPGKAPNLNKLERETLAAAATLRRLAAALKLEECLAALRANELR